MFATLFPQISNVAVTIGDFNIYWYSISYMVAFIAGHVLVGWLDQRNRRVLHDKSRDDLLFFGVLFVILGGRLGYCFFYEFEQILRHPEKIFAIRSGGMSFHGGIAGMTLAMLFVARKYKIEFFVITDLVSIVAPLGIFFGRIANFINAELYGRVTDVPWGMIFPHGGLHPRHPSQLYEAVSEGLLLFIIMLVLFKYCKKKPAGFLSGTFIALYAIFRIICEFFREPDVQLGFILPAVTMGQILSIPMLVIGLYFAVKKFK